MADTGKMKKGSAAGGRQKYEKKLTGGRKQKVLFGGIEKNRSLRKIRRIFRCKKVNRG